MKTLKFSAQDGFTLIEVLMAMAIFTIGILGLFGMQSSVITKNVTASTITTGATWATDQIEKLIAANYNDPIVADTDRDGCAGINDNPLHPDPARRSPDWPLSPASAGRTIYNNVTYKIYSNVANNCILFDIPNNNANPAQEQKPKLVRVIVTVNNGGGERQVAQFDYIKQNTLTGAL